MAKPSHPNRKNVLAVVAGFLAVALLSVGVDEVLHILKVYPPWNRPMPQPGLNLLALAYRIAFTVFGGYVAARLSARAPMRQVGILAGLGAAFGTLGVVSTWNLGLGPHWYPIALALTAIPCTWLGGRLALGKTVGYRRPPVDFRPARSSMH
jgi:hypothetical protein